MGEEPRFALQSGDPGGGRGKERWARTNEEGSKKGVLSLLSPIVIEH